MAKKRQTRQVSKPRVVQEKVKQEKSESLQAEKVNEAKEEILSGVDPREECCDKYKVLDTDGFCKKIDDLIESVNDVVGMVPYRKTKVNRELRNLVNTIRY